MTVTVHMIIITCGDSLTAVLITGSISEYLLPDRAWYDFVCPWSYYSCCYRSSCGTADSTDCAMVQPYFCRISTCHSLWVSLDYYTCKQHTYSAQNCLILWYCRLLWLSCGTSMTLGRMMNDPVVIYYDWLIQLVHEADTFVL